MFGACLPTQTCERASASTIKVASPALAISFAKYSTATILSIASSNVTGFPSYSSKPIQKILPLLPQRCRSLETNSSILSLKVRSPKWPNVSASTPGSIGAGRTEMLST